MPTRCSRLYSTLDVLQEKTPAKTRNDFTAKILQRRAATRDDTGFVDLSDEANVKYAWAAAPAELRELFHRMELLDVLAEAGVRRQHSVGMSTPRIRRELEKLRRAARRRVSRCRGLGRGEIQTISIRPVNRFDVATPAEAA